MSSMTCINNKKEGNGVGNSPQNNEEEKSRNSQIQTQKDKGILSNTQASDKSKMQGDNKTKMLEVEDFYIEFSSQGNRKELIAQSVSSLSKEISLIQQMKKVFLQSISHRN